MLVILDMLDILDILDILDMLDIFFFLAYIKTLVNLYKGRALWETIAIVGWIIVKDFDSLNMPLSGIYINPF